jgi:hypothetical protein
MQKVVDRALQVHGGLGMTDDTILAFFYRMNVLRAYNDGADEVHKTAVAKGYCQAMKAEKSDNFNELIIDNYNNFQEDIKIVLDEIVTKLYE